jgi:hypothetical protein
MAEGRHWVLDTGTKGTGAEMVPLEKTLEHPARRPRPTRARPEPGRRVRRAAEPRGPLRFRVADAVSRHLLADRVDTRGAVESLRDVRSVVDMSIYVWEPRAERWRPLTHGEKQLLWGFRESLAPARS